MHNISSFHFSVGAHSKRLIYFRFAFHLRWRTSKSEGIVTVSTWWQNIPCQNHWCWCPGSSCDQVIRYPFSLKQNVGFCFKKFCIVSGLAPSRRHAITWTNGASVQQQNYKGLNSSPPLDKKAAFLQTTVSSIFSWIKRVVLRFEFHWGLFLRVQLTMSQRWFR